MRRFLAVLSLLVLAAPAAAQQVGGFSLERHVARLADVERRERGDGAAAGYVERWLAARAEGREVPAEPEIPEYARRYFSGHVEEYERLAEALRRAEHWEAEGSMKHPLAAANLALARYHLSKGVRAPVRRISDLLREAVPNICRLDFPPVPAPAPPAPLPPPTAWIGVDPAEIERGQEATLSWRTTNATEARIDGASVPLEGARPERPEASRGWAIVARGPGGEAVARTEIAVRAPAPPLWARVHFDFDLSLIRAADEDTLAVIAREMRKNPAMRVRVEGHTDAKGSNEYNLGLSQRRAQAARDYLVERFGIEPDRFALEGLSEDRPIALNAAPDGTDDPDGRAMNRRAEFHEIR